MRVSATPHRPKPPQSNVSPPFMSAIASAGEETILLISFREGVEAKVRARRYEVF